MPYSAENFNPKFNSFLNPFFPPSLLSIMIYLVHDNLSEVRVRGLAGRNKSACGGFSIVPACNSAFPITTPCDDSVLN